MPDAARRRPITPKLPTICRRSYLPTPPGVEREIFLKPSVLGALLLLQSP